MDLECAPSFNSIVDDNFAIPSDYPDYFYNGSHQIMQQSQQQQHQQQQLQQQQQQQYVMQDQHQPQQQQLPYPESSVSPFIRFSPDSPFGISNPALARALNTLSADKNRRPRGEKKPIPEEQKDDKYFERRRRNNEAAKKSRDARKAREDELALRASFLEQDNSVLQAQVHAMRDETAKMRELWVAKCQGMAVNHHIHQNQQQDILQNQQNILQNQQQNILQNHQQGNLQNQQQGNLQNQQSYLQNQQQNILQNQQSYLQNQQNILQDHQQYNNLPNFALGENCLVRQGRSS